jgi:hypothetical protein
MDAPSDPKLEPRDEPEPLGGEPPCWAHLLDDDGRMPEPARPPAESRSDDS